MKFGTPLILAALMVGSAISFAQSGDRSTPGGPRGAPGGPEDGRRPPPAIIAALDLNHDGVISADKIAKAPESLKKLDKNGDGQLTPDELHPPRPPGGPRRNEGPQQNGRGPRD